MKKIRVGIFFGGTSREREISFAGGRTVFDNLNKSIFEPIPLFVDSHKSLIKLDWQYVYKGTIRDFYPPVDSLPDSHNNFQIYLESIGELQDQEYDNIKSKVGQPLSWPNLRDEIDIAFLALHGEFGEDGQIQGILQSMHIPYTGSGILPCAIGMDKGIQKRLMEAGGFNCPTMIEIHQNELDGLDYSDLFQTVRSAIGNSFVIRPANQGSSIGVSILHDCSLALFEEKINHAFFIKKITKAEWNKLNQQEKLYEVRVLGDLRDGLGFPMMANDLTIYHPEELLTLLEKRLAEGEDNTMTLRSYHSERSVIIESFIEGREFSCIVIRNSDGKPVALPPTEIKKQGQLYDYRSKYLPGLSRKITPIDLHNEDIEAIRSECEKLYKYLGFNTYARIDGFFTSDGKIFLNDPNTTSGMMPSSFFFHQAAEIGLDPSSFLSYIIRASLDERKQEQLFLSDSLERLQNRLDQMLADVKTDGSTKKRIGVVLGGYSFERHISVESGRNIYEKLASSEEYIPIPIFLKRTQGGHELYQIPINLLLKDNADDISDKIEHHSSHEIISDIRKSCRDITEKYASTYAIERPQLISYDQLRERVDAVFIALHGRPGEDGTIQMKLREVGIPYNGSHTASSQITINKFDTLQLLKKHGFEVANQLLFHKSKYISNPQGAIAEISQTISYPFIAKPVDDGCSSAVRKINDKHSFEIYLDGIFRDKEELTTVQRERLKLAYNEEFPQKDEVLIESLIEKGDAQHFLEITGGLLTHRTDDGIRYEVFEPSEALAGGEILSLEEKFLAGEGQNITPARFGDNYESIAQQVKADLEKAARLLMVEGYARIDAFVKIYADGRVKTIIIEVNSLPGMTPATCIFHQTAINGYRPIDFIDKIMQYAINE